MNRLTYDGGSGNRTGGNDNTAEVEGTDNNQLKAVKAKAKAMSMATALGQQQTGI
jgi:hypothetical protein